MTRTYRSIEITFRDRRDWLLPTILAERARSDGSKVYLREAEGQRRSWTYSEMAAAAQAVGANLQVRGFEAGDRLGIMMANCPEYIFAWFGASCAGVVEAPINPEYKGAFLQHAVSLLGPRAVVVDDGAVAALQTTRAMLPDDLSFFVVGNTASDVDRTIEAIRALGWCADPFAELLKPSPLRPVHQNYWDLGSIICTSGTTGPSKGVMMSHAQLYFFAEETRSMARITDSDTLMLALPLFHGNAQFMTAYPALIAGAEIVIFKKFSPGKFLERIRRFHITYMTLMGVMMDWVMSQPEQSDDSENTLRAVLSAPTPFELAGRFRERFGVEVTVECFGQTEISLPIITDFDNDRPPGAAGLLVADYYDVRIVDPESDEELPNGEVGELIVRPKLPWIINSGYWDMPEATAEARRNAWFHTGDAVRRDDEGWFYFVDRIKDSLRRRGENISSFEVENAIQAHPDVETCAVIAVPAEYEGGEDEVMAVVVIERPVETAVLAAWAAEHMPRFLTPRYWRIVEMLPTTPSAKVRKDLLRREGITADTLDASR